jgi:nucleoside phosphorylase
MNSIEVGELSIMNWKYAFLATLLLAVVLGGTCAFLYAENVSLHLQQTYLIGRDPTPRIGIVVALPSEALPVFAEFSREGQVIAYGFNFSLGQIAGQQVVIVVCGIGEESAASAVLAMNVLFNLEWAVNIGTSGAHSPNLEVGDVLVGAHIISAGSRKYSSLTEWDLLADGIFFPNGTQLRFQYLNSTPSLLDLAATASKLVVLPATPGDLTGNGKTHQPIILLNATIASSNFWIANSTLIEQVLMRYGTDAEEEEAYGFALTCYRLGIPFLKIAVISNSEITGSRFAPTTVQVSMTNGATLLQEMIRISNQEAGAVSE